jgi:hypothetical protein
MPETIINACGHYVERVGTGSEWRSAGLVYITGGENSAGAQAAEAIRARLERGAAAI